MVSDTVWMRDGRLSSRTPKVGSWTTGRAPAPSAPIAISTVPVAPNTRVRRSEATSAAFSGDPTVTFVGVPARDRRAEGPQAGCHQSSVAGGLFGRRCESGKGPLLDRVRIPSQWCCEIKSRRRAWTATRRRARDAATADGHTRSAIVQLLSRVPSPPVRSVTRLGSPPQASAGTSTR